MTDTTAGRGGVGIRLYVSGGEVVKRTFDQVGDSGKKMWAEVALGEKAANPAIRALSSGVNEAKGGVDALAGRTGAAGSVLGAFGFAGVAAAAALGGLVVAMGKTREAMAFADEIDDSAQKLGIGTDALQEYRFAMTEVGGSVQDADAAISGFQKKLGEGLAGGRSKKWFEQIGITPAELRGFKDTEEALAAVLDGISKLGTEAERAAVAEKLGLGPMVALAREGSDKLEELRQKAQDLGYVMDDALVKKGADANQQFETMSTIIDVQLKSAFVDLSDEVLAFTGWIAGALGGLNNFIGVFDKWKSRSNALYGDDFVNDLASGNSFQALKSAVGSVVSGRTSGAAAVIRQGGDLYAGTATNAQLRALAAPPPPTASGGTHLSDTSSRGGGGSGGADRTKREAEQRQRDVDRLRESLDRDEVSARRAALRLRFSDDTPDARAQLAKSLLAIDIKERDAKLATLEAELNKKGAVNEATQINLDQVRELNAEADALADRAIYNTQRRALAAEAFEREQRSAESAIALLEIDGQLAVTDAQRFEVSKRILAAQQALERRQLQDEVEADGFTSADDYRRQTRQNAQHAGQSALLLASEDDRLRQQFKGYGREIVGAIQDGRIGEYIGDQLKARLVDGVLDMLFNMKQGGGTGGGSGSGGWLDAAVSFGKSLFSGGRAGGGGVSAGQLVTTNEHGTPELLMLGGSGHVSNAAQTAEMIKAMAGDNSGSGPSGAFVHQSLSFDLKGAVVTEDLLRQMQAMAANAGQQAVAQASDIARRSAPGRQQRQRRLGTS